MNILLRLFLISVLTHLLPVTVAQAQNQPLYWRLQENSVFTPTYSLRETNGKELVTLSGRSLVAMMDAKSRIAEQYGIQPEQLLVTNRPGLNAFAAEVNGHTIVAIHADTIRELGDDRDLWAALFGHEFGHLYHHHSADGQNRAAVINLVSILLDAYQKQNGRNRTELINFGAQLVNNSFTRDQEREADATGLEYMVRAGFAPSGATRLQQLLVNKYGDSGILSFLNSHPSGIERINNIRQQISILPLDLSSTSKHSFSPEALTRHIVLCSGEAKNQGVDKQLIFRSIFDCLNQYSPEFGKRFSLCQTHLTLRKEASRENFERCVSTAPDESHFGFVAWSSFCNLDALAKKVLPNNLSDQETKCVFENDKDIALRGLMCKFEAYQTRISADQKQGFVQSCSNETSELSKRFDRETWEAACQRKANVLASDTPERSNIKSECMTQAPNLEVKGARGN
jgi:Zn-dependent protease with chaperone function